MSQLERMQSELDNIDKAFKRSLDGIDEGSTPDEQRLTTPLDAAALDAFIERLKAKAAEDSLAAAKEALAFVKSIVKTGAGLPG